MKYLEAVANILAACGDLFFKLIVSCAAGVYLINNLPLIMSLLDSITRSM